MWSPTTWIRQWLYFKVRTAPLFLFLNLQIPNPSRYCLSIPLRYKTSENRLSCLTVISEKGRIQICNTSSSEYNFSLMIRLTRNPNFTYCKTTRIYNFSFTVPNFLFDQYRIILDSLNSFFLRNEKTNEHTCIKPPPSHVYNPTFNLIYDQWLYLVNSRVSILLILVNTLL